MSGDDSRNLGPPYLDKNLKKPMESSYFLSVNRNKNSVELDFTKKEGQELAKKLIKKCDVLVENFRAGTGAGASMTSNAGCNISIGLCAGAGNIEGDDNVFIGCNAGCNFTGGYNNIAIGKNALKPHQNSYHNIAIGQAAMAGGGLSIDNVVFGRNAGPGTGSGDNYYNFITGHYAGFCYTDARCNIIFGNTAHYEANSVCDNIIMGDCAGKCRRTGNNNIVFGKEAFLGSSSCTSNTGGANVIMGKRACLLYTSPSPPDQRG